MSFEIESTKVDDEDFSCGLLLRDVEEISKALYLHTIPRKAFNSSYDHHGGVVAKNGISQSKSNVVMRDSSHKDKKSSIWNWKPLKALTHIRNHRFNCCFFLHVHAIEGLPLHFNDYNLCVSWKRKSDMLRTSPARVFLGTAEFEETLMRRCTIYASKTGPHSSVEYEPKLFLLRASVIEAPTLDIGSRWIDLSRLLPLSVEELEGDKSSSGKWTTSFKLTGEAKGAMLNISFGFSIVGGNSSEAGYFVKVPYVVGEGGLNHYGDFDSVPGMSTGLSNQPSQSAKSKFIEEISRKQESEVSQTVTLLYQKFDDRKVDTSMEFDLYHEHPESLKREPGPTPESAGGETEHEFNETEFDVIEQGIEKCSSLRFRNGVIETIDIAEIFAGEEMDFDEFAEWNSKLDMDNHDEHDCTTDDPVEPAFEGHDSAFCDMSTEKDSLLDISTNNEQENYMKSSSSRKAQSSMKSLSLGDVAVAESIENDFLDMLSTDQSGDDTLAFGNPILDPGGFGKVAFGDAFDLSFAIQAVGKNRGSVNQSFTNKRDVEVLENLETEALMHEWGLTEKAFDLEYSPCGFGSPVYVPAEEPLQLPSLEEGVGPIIQTRDGGFMRSMNPLLFINANNGARLIVQVSAPVVLPSAMGFTVMEMLQCWATVGVEKMCIQANELMPLEDVTGKTVQQVQAEGKSKSDASNRWALRRESDFVRSCDTLSSGSNSDQIDSDYVSLEDLVPMAITTIEGLLIGGLKIQSGIPDQEAPSSIRIQLGGNSASQVSKFSSERASGFQVLDVDELIKYSLSLEEWVGLDSGELYVEDESDEKVLKLFAAHSAKPIELRSRQADRSGGFFNNNFRLGLKLQLRNPLRNYEMVGSSMLVLIQVVRLYSLNRQQDVLNEHTSLEGVASEQNETKTCWPLFKVSEAHLAGVHGDKPLWGTSRQKQSGSRWLLSSGMASSNKNLISNSNAVVKFSSGLMRKTTPGDTLWSMSFPGQGEAATWDDQIALNAHVRNPDIVFPAESVK